MKIEFRIAATPDEFDIIRRMNNDVFASEIGQHEASPDGRLVDPFESRSQFLLAFDSGREAAMVCFHCQPPYSVERKLADPTILDSLPRPLYEIRLLAVGPTYRGSSVLTLLLVKLFDILRERRAKSIVISGITSQAQMYETLGFTPLGPPVQSGAAEFIPMMLDLDHLPGRAEAIRRRYAGRAGN